MVAVTGASSGLGRALAQAGASVVLAARRVDALESAALECRRIGGQALAVPTNVRHEAAVRDLAARAVA